MTVRAFTVVPSRSGVLRGTAEREVLDLLNTKMAAVALSGYIFFGSSVSISDQACPPLMYVPSVEAKMIAYAAACLGIHPAGGLLVTFCCN